MGKRKSSPSDRDECADEGASSPSAQSTQEDSTVDDIDLDSDKLIKTLNALSTCQFRDQCIPSEKLTYAAKSHSAASHPQKVVTIDFKASADLSKEELDSCFALIEKTSRADYEPSSFGWHPKRKRKEMRESEMRYLLVREPVNTAKDGDVGTAVDLKGVETVAGFLSFMLTHDSVPSVPVLYLYEIHLESRLRGTGLGAHLMALAETVARKTGVEKVMLTCFVSNEKARRFYEQREFARDASSPEERRTRRKVVKVDHVILSKRVGRGGGEKEGPGGENGGNGLLGAVRDWTAKLAGTQVRDGKEVAQMRGWV